MKLYHDSKVYVLCPGNIKTGGPESLHQLCSQLTQLGINAFMAYVRGDTAFNTDDPVHDFYRKYHLPYTFAVEDSERNIVIIPEYFNGYLYDFEKIQRVLWWLSVNNYFTLISGLFKMFASNALMKPIPRLFYFAETDSDIEHWGQSEYVRQFLRLNGVKKVQAVETHMSQNFLERAAQIDFAAKKNIVAYNPKKGFEFTEQLMKLAPNIDWQPIEDMTPAQVQNLLASAKVYVDFGDFPGRERLPREAALSGCVVITGKSGAAANDIDINIPAEFKFGFTDSKPYQAIEKIHEVFKNFGREFDKQRAFREHELNAQKIFTATVAEIFGIKKLPPPVVAFAQGVGEKSLLLAQELFRSTDFQPRFIVDDVLAATKISDAIIFREQNRNYLRVGENLVEIITRDDAKFLYLEGRIKNFMLLEPEDDELAALINFYAPRDEDVLIFER